MPEPQPVLMASQTARRLAITKQHLAGKRPKNPGPETIMNLFRELNYVQLDPTQTVAPSHLIVLWSRLGAIRESDLDRLLWKDRRLFEYWAHLASIVLTEDYPLYSPRMKRLHQGNRVWDVRLREWTKANSKLKEYVLGEIRSRGPLLSRDIEDRSEEAWDKARSKWGLKPSDWSSGRSVSRMLELLFHDGTIMVAGRQGRQKLWDLSERLLPDWTPKTSLTEAEVEYLGAQRSLKALGVATPKEIIWHFLIWRYPNWRSTIQHLMSDSKILPVELTDGPPAKGRFYIHADDVDKAEVLSRGSGSRRPPCSLLSTTWSQTRTGHISYSVSSSG